MPTKPIASAAKKAATKPIASTAAKAATKPISSAKKAAAKPVSSAKKTDASPMDGAVTKAATKPISNGKKAATKPIASSSKANGPVTAPVLKTGKEPTERQMQRVHGALESSREHKWNLIDLGNEFRRLGLSYMEWALYSQRVWFGFTDGTSTQTKSDLDKIDFVHFPYDAAKANKAISYTIKGHPTREKFFQMLRDAGICCFELDVKNGKLILNVEKVPGTNSHGPVLERKLPLKSGSLLNHKNQGRINALFKEAEEKGWSNAKVYGQAKALGIDSYTSYFTDQMGLIHFADGTTYDYSEANWTPKVEISSKFDRKAAASLIDMFERGTMKFYDFYKHMAEVGISGYTTDLANAQIVAHAAGSKGNSFAVPITIARTNKA